MERSVVEQPRVLDDEGTAEQFVGRERRRVAPIVVDEEESRAAPVQQRQPDVGRERRCLLVVLDESLQARQARERLSLIHI